ncbi:beta-lactamase [Pseudomonas saudimassiliensis]|uniref:Beta-lactamase n=1 Tax=Pseudomonas saudimassiliensis TaxID=1461581 RepID=A0A078M9D8_9PSED|nr:serine hydrolase domain-containing protein [Pseudomonas saudimassiliensis]CEA02849.1 beta-lactamase [Pseudomonas saudimassiliensis]CEF25974.1 beta-lactamase [Pseudomonas saudimassiliensis]
MRFVFVRLVKTRLVILLIVGLLFAAGIAHLVIAERLLLLRSFFPVVSFLSIASINCSEGAPEWMDMTLKDAALTMKSSSNQLVYISPAGQAYHCESGWEDGVFTKNISKYTRFRYASLTKLLTADAVLKLERDGKLYTQQTLDELFLLADEVVDQRVKEITLKHLLNHQAGFDRLLSSDPLFSHNKMSWCPQDLLVLEGIRLDFEPGDRASYSNLGYCLLGAVIEKITGKPYRQYMEQQYGLNSTGIKFIDGPYLEDEVAYNFYFSDFYGVGYYKFFDFYALSSSAGLSGSAFGLASLLHGLDSLDITELEHKLDMYSCAYHKFRFCYIDGVNAFRPVAGKWTIYSQGGFLPGSSALAAVDGFGGLIVWVGGGAPLGGDSENEKFITQLYWRLDAHYKR